MAERRKYRRYTDENIIEAVQTSYSVMQVLDKLEIKKAGGSHYNISKRIKKMGLDTSHFTRQGHMKGKPSLNRKSPEEILVLLPKDDLRARPKTAQLVRALREIGRKYSCEGCEIGGEYNGLPLTLEVDHIDGNYSNNLEDNLRFLCPNCHSQTPTHSRNLTK